MRCASPPPTHTYTHLHDATPQAVLGKLAALYGVRLTCQGASARRQLLLAATPRTHLPCGRAKELVRVG